MDLSPSLQGQQKRIPELNMLYVSPKMNIPRFNYRKQPGGYLYEKDKLIIKAGLEPVYRYAKDYRLHGKDVNLVLITLDPDTRAVEDWFEKTYKSLKKSVKVKEIILNDENQRMIQKLNIYYEPNL